LGSYALVYLVKGGGEYGDARGVRRPVRQGDLIWIFPELAHHYGPLPGGRWDEIYLVFTGPVFDLWRGQGLLDPDDPVWHLAPPSYWLDQIASVAQSAQSSQPAPPGGDLEPAIRLQALFTAMREKRVKRIKHAPAAGHETPERHGEGSWLPRARHLLDNPALSLEEVAHRAGMKNYDVFRKQFTRHHGASPAAYRQNRRIERACLLLMQPGATNKRIAEELGFCDEFHFAKTFSNRMGFTPRAFRRQALGQNHGPYDDAGDTGDTGNTPGAKTF